MGRELDVKHAGATGFNLVLGPQRFTIHRLPPDAPLPFAALRSASWYSVTRTPDELSIVVPHDIDPGPGEREPGWSCLRVEGTLEFTLVGVIAALSRLLADAGISIFTVSTYDTDYLFVKSAEADAAIRALSEGGHTVTDQRANATPR